MWALAFSTAAILLAVLVVAMTPIRGRASGVLSDDEISGAAELGWGCGLLRLTVASDEPGRVVVLGVWSIPLSTIVRSSKDPTKRKKRESASRRRRWGSMRDTRPRVAWAMACRIVQAAHVRVFFGGRLGLTDPADAATLEAVTRVSRQFAPPWLELDLHVHPFAEDTELLGRAGFWILPAEVVVVVASWILWPETRRVLRALA